MQSNHWHLAETHGRIQEAGAGGRDLVAAAMATVASVATLALATVEAVGWVAMGGATAGTVVAAAAWVAGMVQKE